MNQVVIRSGHGRIVIGIFALCILMGDVRPNDLLTAEALRSKSAWPLLPQIILQDFLHLCDYIKNVKMSSMRNAVQRRNHKERAQPLERSKWGLLEKHKVCRTLHGRRDIGIHFLYRIILCEQRITMRRRGV